MSELAKALSRGRRLLDALTERPNLAYTRRQLIERVWGWGWVGDELLVDIHIAHLPAKLGDPPPRRDTS